VRSPFVGNGVATKPYPAPLPPRFVLAIRSAREGTLRSIPANRRALEGTRDRRPPRGVARQVEGVALSTPI